MDGILNLNQICHIVTKKLSYATKQYCMLLSIGSRADNLQSEKNADRAFNRTYQISL